MEDPEQKPLLLDFAKQMPKVEVWYAQRIPLIFIVGGHFPRLHVTNCFFSPRNISTCLDCFRRFRDDVLHSHNLTNVQCLVLINLEFVKFHSIEWRCGSLFKYSHGEILESASATSSTAVLLLILCICLRHRLIMFLDRD